MRKIEIAITKGRLESFTATFNEDDTLDLSATLALMTDSGERVSSFSLNTQAYRENKFNLPYEVVEPIFEIAKKIEELATLQCRARHEALPAPTNDNE